MRDIDPVALEILDIIRASATTDFIYIYNFALDNAGNLMHTLMQQKNKKLVSTYGRLEGALELNMQSVIDAYLD